MRLSRRSVLLAAAAAAWAKPRGFRYAVCNETFEGLSFAEGCRAARRTGYTGLEIAPITLGEDPSMLPKEKRREYRRAMADEGIVYAGLHSLVSAPRGLHLTTPDKAVRERSWEYFRRLIELSADLGSNGVMVLGSGKQRGAVNGSTVPDATRRLTDGLASLAPHAQKSGVLLLLEPLSPQFTNVVNSMAEAVDVVKQIGSPAVQSMFDTHNTVAETEPHDAVIRRYAPYIKHVHVNEMDGRHPGTGSYDFGLVLRTLKEIGYSGWVSLEVFQFKPSGETIARDTMALLRRLER